MIISVEKLRQYITTDLEDSVLEEKLQALELLIRKYTNNNFQNRNIRFNCNISSNKLVLTTPYLKKGDTVQITESTYNEGVYAVTSLDNGITLDNDIFDESNVLITKVVYPTDIQMGVINLMNWDINNRDKVGMQSETISRHSVTYFNMDGDNSLVGFPKSLIGFLNPYMKARF